uniref:ubiquitinyl hydrolase 1 n=1 Tax=Sinocyclocheilus grahami TaxID=75366 RepID=A0A672T080_SINGR
MTILPKKKPASTAGGGDHTDEPDRRGGSESNPHPLAGRSGSRPRASPPPWTYQATPHTTREERRIEASARPRPASPLPAAAGAPLPCGAGGVGSCCSGPGLSKRRRQAVCSSGLTGGGGRVGGGGSPVSEPEEGAGGNNSEDEYENAARFQHVDPATVEQQEEWFEKALREKKGYEIKKMKEDGACLFRAVADQVYGDQDMHDVVRKQCMDYLTKNADYFSSYVTEDFTTYINRKRKNNCHGNHIEMQAMAEMYNRPVEVYQYGIEPINTFHGIQENNDEPIRVSYHKNIHYNSVVNPYKASVGVGLGLPSFKPGYADQCLMKNAIKTSEESWIEQQMLEDKKRATDWEATNEAIEEQVARESYLQWLQDQEKQARQPRKASATCSSATAATSSGFEDWGCRSPHQRSSAPSPEHPASLVLPKPPSPCAPGPSHQSSANSSLVSLYPSLGYRTLMQEMSPTAFGLTDWEDDDVLASVMAASQQEYLDSLMKNAMHRESSPDCS